MEKFILIHYYVSFEGGGGIEVDYFNTFEEAKKSAVTDDTIAKVVEEVE